MNAETLKPCPFCGGEAEYERKGDNRQSTIVSCTMCGCVLESGIEWDHWRDWNTRAADNIALQAEVESLKMQVEILSPLYSVRQALSDENERLRELLGEAYEQPTPSPEPEPVAWQVKDFADGWITFDSKFKALDYAEPVSAHVRPLYASPPTPASHAEELRKAKEAAEFWERCAAINEKKLAEAWDEGFSACEDPNLDIRCNPYAAPEGGE